METPSFAQEFDRQEATWKTVWRQDLQRLGHALWCSHVDAQFPLNILNSSYESIERCWKDVDWEVHMGYFGSMRNEHWSDRGTCARVWEVSSLVFSAKLVWRVALQKHILHQSFWFPEIGVPLVIIHIWFPLCPPSLWDQPHSPMENPTGSVANWPGRSPDPRRCLGPCAKVVLDNARFLMLTLVLATELLTPQYPGGLDAWEAVACRIC